jgi:hypothetical protein
MQGVKPCFVPSFLIQSASLPKYFEAKLEYNIIQIFNYIRSIAGVTIKRK